MFPPHLRFWEWSGSIGNFQTNPSVIAGVLLGALDQSGNHHRMSPQVRAIAAVPRNLLLKVPSDRPDRIDQWIVSATKLLALPALVIPRVGAVAASRESGDSRQVGAQEGLLTGVLPSRAGLSGTPAQPSGGCRRSAAPQFEP